MKGKAKERLKRFFANQTEKLVAKIRTRKINRKINRFLGKPAIIFGIVFAVSSFIGGLFLGWAGVLVALILSGVCVGLSYRYEKTAAEIHYFDRIDFRTPDESTIRETVEGILNTQKVEPFYVHAAPKFDEVSTIRSRLMEAGLAVISGRPGEGKSMAAYQALYLLKQEEQYRVYSLKTEELEEKGWEGEIRDRVFLELDELLKGKRKLILVDDAHRLKSREDLRRELLREAEENNGKYIWIETEAEYEEAGLNECIRVNFRDFKDRLLEHFYKTSNPSLQRTLAGRIDGLEDAIRGIEKGEITDVWHFAFCATRGWERLIHKVEDLKEVELLVLFFISAHTVLNLESELSVKSVRDTILGLGFNWLSEQESQMPISDAIQNLWVEEKLIRIYEKSKHDRYIRSLHRNFAREVIKASILRESYVEDLLISAKALLTDKYHLCVGYITFHQAVGRYAPQFDRNNKNWLTSFINNLSTEWLWGYPILLDSVRKTTTNVHNKIINELDISKLAARLSTIQTDRFSALAHLLNALGHRRDELISNENFDLEKLATEANNAKIEQFAQIENLIVALGQNGNKLIERMNLVEFAKAANNIEAAGQLENLAHLLRALRGRQDELSGKLDLEKLARVASAAEIGEFKQVAELLKCLGQRKSQVSVLLNHDALVQKAKQMGPSDIAGVTMLIAELEEEDRSKFIQEVDWRAICIKCPIHVASLSGLGASLENLWKQAERLCNRVNVKKVTQHLRAHIDKIKQEIGRARPRSYSGAAKFLWNCNQVDHNLAKEMATETMNKLAQRFSLRPMEYKGVGRLINAFYAINPELSASFVQNNIVRGKIQQSINEHDWTEEIEGLKHLIEAFYRSVPELWKKMIDYHWIIVDLSSLNLDSIYRNVDAEKNVGTAYDTT